MRYIKSFLKEETKNYVKVEWKKEQNPDGRVAVEVTYVSFDQGWVYIR